MIDSLYELGELQTLAGSAHQGDNVIDITGGTGAANKGKDAFGNSIFITTLAAKLFMNVRVTTVTAAGACAVGLYTHSAATSIQSGTEIASLSIPSASAVGSMFSVGLPPGTSITWARYMAAVIDTKSNACTGNIDIWLDTSPCTQNKLPS